MNFCQFLESQWKLIIMFCMTCIITRVGALSHGSRAKIYSIAVYSPPLFARDKNTALKSLFAVEPMWHPFRRLLKGWIYYLNYTYSLYANSTVEHPYYKYFIVIFIESENPIHSWSFHWKTDSMAYWDWWNWSTDSVKKCVTSNQKMHWLRWEVICFAFFSGSNTWRCKIVCPIQYLSKRGTVIQ